MKQRELTRVCGVGAAAVVGLAWTAFAAFAAPTMAPSSPGVAQPNAKGAEFFEAKIRPVLSTKCAACHNDANTQGGLNLATHAGLMKGGKNGPAVVPGDPSKGSLLKALNHQGTVKMPPQGKLDAVTLKNFADWVKMGAPWGVEAPKGSKVTRATPQHWAFQPVREPKLPQTRSQWGNNPIDRFILAKLEAKGLKPNPPADRRTLIRRAYFDLIGFPPTPEEVEAFVTDKSPNAWGKVIDRLLAMPQYGERWGRHWLDVARYSDSNGLDWNEIFAHAWRYRDYVIRSYNEDKPFDLFIKEQLAGDLMPGATDEETYERLVATGFLVMGPKLLAQQDRVQLALDVADEQIDVTTKAFLGLTVSCARCHDHKFDPISTKEYYSLAGIFQSTVTLHGTLPRNNRVMYWMERPLAEPERVNARKAHEAQVKKLQAEIKKTKDAAAKSELEQQLKDLQAKAPPEFPVAMAIQEGKPTTLRVHIRGSYENLGPEAPRGFLAAAGGSRASQIPADRSGRLELAEWIVSPENPLTARVQVNRIWHGHFGRGIVPTPDNFGLLGEEPTHPELLDWLAIQFVKNGWSVKKLHRLIMQSATYQMSSAHQPAAYAKDPENRLFWRTIRRRLEAEAIRDAMLRVNDKLDLTMGGSLLLKTTGRAGVDTKIDKEYDTDRRSVYLPVIRGTVHDMLQVFDFGDPHLVIGKRNVTNVPPQALLMLNSPFVAEQSERFADLLLSRTDLDDSDRIELAYQRAVSRLPSAAEVTRALAFLRDYEQEVASTQPDAAKCRRMAWQGFCHALYASSEFRFLD